MSDPVLPEIPYLRFNETVTLTNCDREPIHIPGHIQAFGALVVLNPADLTILQASENLAAYSGVAVEALLNQPATVLFAGAQIAVLQEALKNEQLEGNPLYLLTGPICGKGSFHLTAHVFDGLLTLELEPGAGENALSPDYYSLIKKTLIRFQAASSLSDYCRTVCEEVQRVNGFDRVMVYKFHSDGHGEVIGEVVSETDRRERWLGFHYPEADIPKQARALFILNTLRMTPDMKYRPSLLHPAINPQTGRPLDMRHCLLRGVSQMYTEYMLNMGGRASMSLAIVREGQLWGLIACHHQTPRQVSYDVRAACEFLAGVISLQIAQKEAQEFAEYRTRIQHVSQTLVESMARHEKVLPGLTQCDPDVLSFLDCGGCAVLAEGDCLLLGYTPAEADVLALARWLSQTRTEEVWATDALSAVYPPAERLQETGSGLLALQISRENDDWVIWFRPETIHTVKWGGDPNKPYETGPMGDRLTPRKSFALWKETVQGKSLPWNEIEVEAVRRLRITILEVVTRRAGRLARLNAELAKSNAELDSFAYVASHDLKEPLRGISNYAQFLDEDYAHLLDDEGRKKIATLIRLTRRMADLLDSLMQYSRLGRQELALQNCDIMEIVQETLQSYSARDRENIEIRVASAFPPIQCDRSQIGEVFSNLIVNAIKYNDRPQKRIEIGWRAAEAMDPIAVTTERANSASKAPDLFGRVVYYVRDNGIGIRPQHIESIFRIFKRLHSRDAYGGGSGIGLSIARQIVERHGGRMWVESTYGEGSTFYFTLQE